MPVGISGAVPGVSFRDPGGRVVTLHGRILRIINAAGHECLIAALESRTIGQLIERGNFVRTEVLPAERATELLNSDEMKVWLDAKDCQELVEHEAIQFPS